MAHNFLRLNQKDHEQSGINLVDLMMWLVIAALLLAAALQGIGYYKKATNVYLMKDEVSGVVANIHAASSMEDGKVTEALINKVLTEHNAAHANDEIVIGYGSVTANAAGTPSDTGFELASTVTATSAGNVTYLKASSSSVDDQYVLYFFEATRTFPQGISVTPKTRVDDGSWGSVVTPGETTSPTQIADPSSNESPSATPTPTATTTPSATPTVSPTVEPTVTPSPTATVTPTATPTPTPPPVVKTEIDKKYDAVNGATLLGAPKDVEKDMPAGGGRYRDYAKGSIVWSASYGAFTSMNGPIRDKWIASGGVVNGLGYPTTDDNQVIGSGFQQQYSGGGAIVYSSSTGARISMGGIRVRWLKGGAETGRLGLPNGDETGPLVNGGYKQTYQNGAIYWSPATAGWEMGGAFYGTYLNRGAENSVLGYPTSNEAWIDGDTVRQNFQNGHYMTWKMSTGVTTVY